MNGNGYSGKVIEAGHIYELGYMSIDTSNKTDGGELIHETVNNCRRYGRCKWNI
jgi:hypothetical protein